LNEQPSSVRKSPLKKSPNLTKLQKNQTKPTHLSFLEEVKKKHSEINPVRLVLGIKELNAGD
jgi:hypothetical protein